MARINSLLIAVVSAALVSAVVSARPRYGGTLRIATDATIRTLDPASAGADTEASIRRHVLPLLYETLVAVDASGGLRAVLATSWESDARASRWRFRLRNNVRLHDGASLEPADVAAALRAGRPEWQVQAENDAVVIEPGGEHPDLPWALAELRTAVAVRRSPSALVGTGAFRLDRLETGRLTLRAHDDYWGGRTFVDAVRIEFARPLSSQLSDLEAGRADLVTVQPTDVRRLAQRRLRTAASRPIELFALVFETHRAGSTDQLIRRTLSAAINRAAMCRILMQGLGEPADGVLPAWLSGYPGAVVTAAGATLFRTAIAALPVDRRSLTLRVNPADPLAQSVAERIAVDAREAGFSMTVQVPAGLAPRADLRLARIRLEATSPDRALSGVITALGPRTLASVTREPAPALDAPLEAVARVERALLDQFVIVPVVHIPAVYGLAERVDSFDGPVVTSSGAWNLASTWLRTDRPDQR